MSGVLLAAVALSAAAEKRNSRRKAEPDSAALIAVSVFREPGFAVPAAEIQLAVATESKSGVKAKKIKVTSDARGEYVFHVPPDAMRYLVTASAKGLTPQEKAVEVQGEGRTDVTFTLQQESK